MVLTLFLRAMKYNARITAVNLLTGGDEMNVGDNVIVVSRKNNDVVDITGVIGTIEEKFDGAVKGFDYVISTIDRTKYLVFEEELELI